MSDGTYIQLECDPDSENPCCDDFWLGHCGNSTDHCACERCTDYKFSKKWRKLGGTQKWRYDGKCGSLYPLPDDNSSECDPDGEKYCCDNVSGGDCGNTTEHCSCEDCVDYRTVYRDWRESGGKQRWRYDRRCGNNNRLPDNTPAWCDPDGENPCCSGIWAGFCGNTTEYCSCEDCLDYSILYRDWRESGGKQRWRYDGKCGDGHPLVDNTPAECDPDGENPCCSEYEKEAICGSSLDLCLNLDYRIVRKIREAKTNCTIARLASGFLKYVCFDENTNQLYYKCIYSDLLYLHNAFDYSEVCKNDPYVYQACGFEEPMTNSEVLCGGYICENEGRNVYMQCSGEGCRSANRDCSRSDSNLDCDGKCDLWLCFDEADCGGYRYGVRCFHRWYTLPNFIPAYFVCYMDESPRCDDESDQRDCTITETTEHSCTHYYSKMLGITRIVPILNYTRCSMLDVSRGLHPYCLNYLDQTNCSDVNRVGGYCPVEGMLASISKFVVCLNFDPRDKTPIHICDDNLQNECVHDHATNCTIHKHRMCDDVKDCSDGNDEAHDMCKTSVDKEVSLSCTRRFNLELGNILFPVSWIRDKTVDCMNGEDEDIEKWELCQGKYRQIISPGQKCQDAFICPWLKGGYVPFDKLCDGVESCVDGVENNVCKIARDFPPLDRFAPYQYEIRNVCQGHDDNCDIKEFSGLWGTLDVFGVTTYNRFLVPTSKTNCSGLFGENYLFLSCMGLCYEADIKCPLDDMTGVLMHDACPGQFPNRTFTIANNSFLVFVDQSGRGDYHQEFYQCANSKCVAYDKVCDLFDDCGDMSDEINCKNHMTCEDSWTSSKHHFISLAQRCDGIYDCFDLSDECNGSCGRQILENLVLKIICWSMGILAMLFNFFTVAQGLSSIKECETENMLTSKVLMSLIGTGDFLIGLYLVIISIYDSIIMGEEFCKFQTEWLTGITCLTLGVISTLGSQISLFTMTVLSVIRMYGLVFKAMRVPGPVNKKAVARVISLGVATTTAALAIAVIPLIPSLEDYFVQGLYYDPSYKVFIGFPNKDRHIKVLQAYHDKNITGNTSISWQMSWREISEKVDAMFSHDHGNLTRTPVHFYGNDGLCLYKYFVRSDDARRSRQPVENGTDLSSYRGDPVVWTILALNFFCFMIITCCYIVINIQTKRSSQRSGQQDNPERLRGERAIQNKIMIIIATDFLCWVPFIAISALHSLDYIDASYWYATFAMTVLPLNSVINPLVYDKAIGEFIARSFGRLKNLFLSLDGLNAFTGMFNNNEVQQEPEVIPVQTIRGN